MPAILMRIAGEGLEKDGTSLSQIPTYVTAVPNGTEKVSFGHGLHIGAAF